MILVPSLLVVMLAATAEAKRAGAAPIINVDPDIWVQECATVFQETCCRSDTYPYMVNYSTYDVLKKPSGLCKVRTPSLHDFFDSSLVIPRSILFCFLCIVPISNISYKCV